MTIDCFGNNTSTEVKATSDIFHIFDYPSTGLRVSVNNYLKYNGKASAVEAIIAGFDKDMGTLTCTGCRAAGGAKYFMKTDSLKLFFKVLKLGSKQSVIQRLSTPAGPHCQNVEIIHHTERFTDQRNKSEKNGK